MTWKERTTIFVIFLFMAILFVPLVAGWIETVIEFWGLTR